MEIAQNSPLLLNLFHGLTPRLLLPYFLIVIVVAFSFIISINDLKRHIAQVSDEKAIQITELAATKLKSTLRTSQRIAAFAANLDSPSGAANCKPFAQLVPAGWALSLIDKGQARCTISPDNSGQQAWDSTDLGQALASADMDSVLAIMSLASRPDTFFIATPLGNSATTLVLGVPKTDLLQSDLASSCSVGRIAIESGRNAIPLQDCGSSPVEWLPNTVERSEDLGDFSELSRTGVVGRYQEIGVPSFPASILLRYPSATSELGLESSAVFQAIPYVVICLGAIFAAVWQLDWTIRRRIYAFQQIVKSHNQNQSPARVPQLDSLPVELEELGAAINRMSDNIARHAVQLEAAASEEARLLHELHHRVKNNFQLIASLLRLHKSALPRERQSDIRFIEEHVQAMAIAYRMAYAADDNAHMSAIKIVEDVVKSLQETAKIPDASLLLSIGQSKTEVTLDEGIALALCLTYLLPPYFDSHNGSVEPIRINVHHEGDTLVVGVANVKALDDNRATLRGRLAGTYVRQLAATILEPTTSAPKFIIRIPLAST